ncbi:MobH family relaxase [Paraburkholderia ginsengisoli]|uniref:TraI domain-containing protein n=1 Tax=Paraburkholderia ginsengisoli TaxID=311231 RepID=A0A7T4N308_9BURK|nr:MobH family relaxase [Paraburkholderia ginsengisoli]QQC64333.1 TraI domain-containing protein [Paraburkholderia ginsengisoli]
MFTLFQRKKAPPKPAVADTPPADVPKGLMRPESAASLLATPRRQRLLEHIWQRTALSRAQFATLYRAPLERYAELVQQFPASESHHHAYPGGMLDHGLEIVAYALKLRQSHLMPVSASPETQAAQAEAWTAGTAYAALLHDMGKIAVDLYVEHADGTPWHPWHGPLRQPYRFRYRPDREYRLHSAATGLLYTRLLDRDIMDWLSGYPDLWSALLYVLAGQYEHAGRLGELVIQADQASAAQALGGDPAKALAVPRHALQRKLLDGLRYLLKEAFKLNQPQASDGWLTQDALWLVSKTVSDKLRAHLLSQGIDGIPSSNTAVFNVLQDHGIALPTSDGKAIWKATVISAGGWSHSFTFLKLSPALIWEADERPAPFAGEVRVETDDASSSDPLPQGTAAVPLSPMTTSTATTPMASAIAAPAEALAGLLDLLDSAAGASASTSSSTARSPTAQDAISEDDGKETPAPSPSESPPSTITSTEPSGEHFMAWLRQGIDSHKLVINDARALIHTVANTAYLVSPGVFQRYAQEHPPVARLAKEAQVPDWQWVQKRFEQLHLHRKHTSGLNIWTCEVTGPRKSRRLHGYLLASPTSLYAETPPNNPYLNLLD